MDLCDPIQMRPLTMPSACKALNVWIEQWRQQQDNPLFLQVSDMLRRFHEFQPDLDFISESLLIKLCEYLQQAGILLLLPGSWVVLEPSVFSNRVIGKLFEPSALHNIHTNAVLDVDAIEDLTHGRLYFNDRSTMPTILEHLGLAIRHPFAPDDAPKYFPCFVQHEFNPEFHPTELAHGSRFIGRRFKLVDREHQVFVDGFFPRLFARLYNQLTPHGSRGSDIPQLFKHAIILTRDAPALRGEVDPPAMFLLVEHSRFLNVVVSSWDLMLQRNLPMFQDRVEVVISCNGHGDDEGKEDKLHNVMPEIGHHAASVESANIVNRLFDYCDNQ